MPDTSRKYSTRIMTPSGELHVFVHESNDSPGPTLLLSHGFATSGFESHRMFLDVAEKFVDAGFNAVVFDHIGCGYSDGNFREFLLSDAVTNIGIVFEWVSAQAFSIDDEIYVLGQSLGTAIAIEALASDPRVAGFVLWNLSADFARRYPSLFGDGMAKGQSVCIADKGLFTHPDFIVDAERYSVINRFAEVKCPVLFVNSGSDEKADSSLAQQAASQMATRPEMKLIFGANHSFKCQPELETEAIQASVDWVKRVRSRRRG